MAELKAAWKVVVKVAQMVASKAEWTAVHSVDSLAYQKVGSSVAWWDFRRAVLLAERRAA